MPTTATPTGRSADPRAPGRWTKALYAKDLDVLMALYAPDTVTFDLMPPRKYRVQTAIERTSRNGLP